jgi:hypothetical protein
MNLEYAVVELLEFLMMLVVVELKPFSIGTMRIPDFYHAACWFETDDRISVGGHHQARQAGKIILRAANDWILCLDGTINE